MARGWVYVESVVPVSVIIAHGGEVECSCMDGGIVGYARVGGVCECPGL